MARKPGTADKAPAVCASWCGDTYARAIPMIVSTRVKWWAKCVDRPGGGAFEVFCFCSKYCLTAKGGRPEESVEGSRAAVEAEGT